MREKRTRSVVKSITWRIIAVALSWLAAIGFGIGLWTSIKLVIVANSCSMLAYYVHERVWDKIEYGKEEGTAT